MQRCCWFCLTVIFWCQAPSQVRDGMCDASAGVAWGDSAFWVANDEDNIIRLYSLRVDQIEILQQWDLSSFLTPGKKQEADLEGAARMGQRIWWITSHGANRKGKARPLRRALFATDIVVHNQQVDLVPVPGVYRNLVEDMAEIPELKHLDLKRAAKLPPKKAGALNIEGLAETPEGFLWIGLRSPLLHNKAVLVELRNPLNVLAGAKPVFGPSRFVDLNGQGIRSVERTGLHRYEIISGPVGNQGHFDWWRWNGRQNEKPVRLKRHWSKDFHPEGLFMVQGKRVVLSDDGNVSEGGVPCKERPVQKRRFRWTFLSSQETFE